MTDNNKKIFREKAKHISIQPSEATWDKLSKKLEESKEAKPPVKYFKLFAIAATLTLLVGLLWNNDAFTKEEPIASATQADNPNKKTKAISEGLVHNEMKRMADIQQLPQNTYENFYRKVMEARRNGLLERY